MKIEYWVANEEIDFTRGNRREWKPYCGTPFDTEDAAKDWRDKQPNASSLKIMVITECILFENNKMYHE